MLVKLAFVMQRLKKYQQIFVMINKDGGGDNFSILWGDTAVMRGDIELMGVPSLVKTLILPWLMPLLPYKQSICQFQVRS